MREIKFRAWIKSIEKMGEVLRIGDIIDTRCYSGLDKNETIIMQYTGLKDKNGKEIYEGDVVSELNLYGKPIYEKVEWLDSSCGFEPFSDSSENCGCCGGGLSGKNVEVIGNIYDNPELIK